MTPEGGRQQRRADWRGSQKPASPVRRAGNWRAPRPAESVADYQRRQNLLLLERLVTTGAALLLVGALIWWLFDSKPAVPLIAAVISDYGEPFGPLSLAALDRTALADAGRESDSFRRGTILSSDLARDIEDADKDTLRDRICQRLESTPAGGPGREVAIVYITAIGAVDRDGRACLVPRRPTTVAPGDIEHLDRSWLRVADLLETMAAVKRRPRTVLVVLDACRPAHGSALGILDGGFAAAVAADFRVQAQPGFFLVVPAGPGQTSCAAPPDSVSVFAGSFLDALEGCADDDRNTRVSVRELADYLAREVTSRALLRHGRPQTPFVLPDPESAENNPDISFAVRRAPASWTAPRPQSEEGEAEEWLATRWQRAEQLRSRGPLEQPELWARLEQRLLRAERLAAEGEPPDPDSRRALDDLFERLERPWLSGGDRLPGLRLANLAAPLDATADARWNARLLSASPQESDAGSEPAPPPRDEAEWRARAQLAWDRGLAQVRAGAAPDRGAWQRWLELLEARPPPAGGDPPAPWPFEWQVARLLADGADPAAWQREPGALSRVIELTHMAVEASLPEEVRSRPDRAAIDRADAKRREAFDLAAVGDERSLARAARLCAEAAEEYEAIAADTAVVSAAWKLLDRVRAEMPWLAIWRTALTDVPPADATPPAAIWEAVVAEAQDLEARLYQVGTEPSARQPKPRAADRLGPVAKSLERSFSEISERFRSMCDRLDSPSADNAATLAQIRGVLATPLVQGAKRGRLVRRERSLSDALAGGPVRDAEDRSATPRGSAAPAARHWLDWKGGSVEPLVATLIPNPRPMPAGKAADPAEIARAHGVWGQAVRDAVSAGCGSFAAGGSRTPDVPGSAAGARRLAVLLGSLPEACLRMAGQTAPATEHLGIVWHERLLQVADDMLDEFLGGCDRSEPMWCAEAARLCLREAESLAPNTTAHDRLASRLEKIASVRRAWGRITTEPDRIGGGGGARSAPVRTSLELEPQVAGEVPIGEAAMWISPGSPDASLWLSTDADATVTARRIALPVARNDTAGAPRGIEWRADLRATPLPERGTLDLTAWFRGSTARGSLPVATDGSGVPLVWQRPPPAPARITVEGRDRQSGHISFIFDCSGSMEKKIPSGTDTRFQIAKTVFGEILDAMALVGKWNVSIRFYGHRMGWNNAADPPVPKPAPMFRGGNPGLLPGQDVEDIFVMQPLTRQATRAIANTLGQLQGWGETPLYYAIQTALENDGRAVPPDALWRIIAITDGVNQQLRNPTKAADLQRELDRTNQGRNAKVQIDVIAIDLEKGALDREDAASYDELQRLIRGNAGAWRDANDTARLKQAFREFLQLVRWEVVDRLEQVKGSRELGDFLEVPPGDYAVRVEGQKQTAADVFVHGGENLRLFRSPRGRLEHQRYDGGNEQGIRDRQEDLVDPGSAETRWFVAAHLPRREGASVRFPVSIQNNDPGGFSPRPSGFWAELRPAGVAGARPFVFVDMDIEPDRPVPVADLVVPKWPAEAREAELLVWFSPRDLEPDAEVKVDELGWGQPREFKQLPAVTLVAGLERIDARTARLNVEERHRGAEDLPRLRLEVKPACERAEHLVNDGAATVSHRFDIRLDDGNVPAGTRLVILGRDRFKEQSIQPRSTGGRLEPLVVAVPVD